MNSFPGIEVLLILVLILANGVFAAAEIAVISARRGRLEQRAATGARGARQALQLAVAPDRFLATVQVGITLIGTLASAFGGVSLSIVLAQRLAEIPALAPYAETVALAIVVLGISYLSLVLGELAPKRLALRHAEGIAMATAPLMAGLARFAAPVVALLSASASVVLHLLGQREGTEQGVTEEDVLFLAREGTAGGAIEADEAELVARVFRLTDRRVREVMTPRGEIEAIEITMPLAEVLRVFRTSGYSRLPVYRGELDVVEGILHAKDLLHALIEREGGTETRFALAPLLRPAVFVAEGQRVDEVLQALRERGTHLVLVSGEYGEVSGLVTLEDLLEELVGEIQDEFDTAEAPEIVRRPDGSWLVSGRVPYEVAIERLGLPAIPPAERGRYLTLAGLVLARLGRIPTIAETVEIGDFTVEIVDMDGRRIDMVLVRRRDG